MINIDRVVEKLPHSMYWYEVKKLLEALNPDSELLRRIVGDYVDAQTSDRIVDSILDAYDYGIEELGLGD